MIKLKSDTLQFHFPEIGEEITRLAASHLDTALASLRAATSTERLRALRQMPKYMRSTGERRRAAERAVDEISARDLEDLLRRRHRIVMRHQVTDCTVTVTFQRTLRIPDDGNVYPLPAGFGPFPLRLIDDHQDTAPPEWVKKGGVLMPMYQSEALWIRFSGNFPFAMKVATGKVNAVTGEAWKPGLSNNPQNYLVLPQQPWLDGFSVGSGLIRQFVAMPLGSGYSVEEQVTGRAETGGMQFEAFPLKPGIYFEDTLKRQLPARFEDLLEELVGDLLEEPVTMMRCSMPAPCCAAPDAGGMGLGAGGTMRQEIYADTRNFTDWDTSRSSRCFVHLCNSLTWREITGEAPPSTPVTAREYARSGIPWFDYYRDDLPALTGSGILAKVKSIFTLGKEKGDAPLPDNHSTEPKTVIQYGSKRRPDEVLEWKED